MGLLNLYFLNTAPADYEDEDEGTGEHDLANPRVVDNLLMDDAMEGTGSSNSANRWERLPRLYYTTKKARQSVQETSNISGGVASRIDTGSFETEEDNRIEAAYLKHIFTRGQNISASYNLMDMRCNSCTTNKHHLVLEPEGEGENENSAPPCFVLADHNFPAIIQTTEAGDCIKILRIEDGSLNELVEAFVDTVKGFTLPVGTVVVLCSLSQLVMEGPNSYAVAFRNATLKLTKKFGMALKTCHGIPVNVFTMESQAVRAWSDFVEWATAHANKQALTATMAAWLPVADAGNAQTTYEWRGGWPKDMTSREMATMVSSGVKDLPNRVPPARPEREYELISFMIEELNGRYAVELATDISSVRNLDGSSDEEQDLLDAADAAPKQIRIVVVGGSHASRLASELSDREEVELIDLSEPGWRVTDSTLDSMKTELLNALSQDVPHPTLVVYHIFDNNVFLGRTRDGTRTSKKGEDGRYHIVGSLTVMRDRELEELLVSAIPLLKAGKHHRKLLIAPVRRYINAPCCGNPDHVTNFGEKDFLQRQTDDLDLIRDTMRTLYYRKHVTNFRVSSSDKLLGWGEEEGTLERMSLLWGTDPVHLSVSGYKEMAKRIMEAGLTKTPFTNPKEPRRPEAGGGRSGWISCNETTIKRRPSPTRDNRWVASGSRAHRGSTRGRGIWRGGWRGQKKFRPY